MKNLLRIFICIWIITFICGVSYSQTKYGKVYDGRYFQGSSSTDGFSPAELVTGAKIYEALFLYLLGGEKKTFYLADTTENRWFIENPQKTYNWEWLRGELGGVSTDLVQLLYYANRSFGPVQWESEILKPTFLPKEYAIDYKGQSGGVYCLVERGKGNTGISFTFNHDVEFRSYYTVSKVAFSLDGRFALVKFSKHCAPLKGAGESFAVLKLIGSRWKVISTATLWIS